MSSLVLAGVSVSVVCSLILPTRSLRGKHSGPSVCRL
jgi:hypothetical protein